VLARIGQIGEVFQQRDAARRCQGEASIDEAPMNRTFNRVGSYPSLSSDWPGDLEVACG
jgi:hypothetical protein